MLKQKLKKLLMSNKNMDFKKWEIYYRKILEDFSFSAENDEKSAVILNQILENKKILSLKKIEKLIKNNEIIVFGGGPSLKKSYEKHIDFIKNKIKITADGATTLLIENDIYPDIVVTDLDGRIQDQLKANKKGSIVVIHAHGDNIKNIKKIVPNFTGHLIGTTQTNPKKYFNLHNFGGFTDGDRAVFLADHFKAKKIFLIGFDFDGKIGRYSFTKNFKIKNRKLEWCKFFIEKIMEKNKNIEFL